MTDTEVRQVVEEGAKVFGIRLRFRTTKGVTTDDPSYSFDVGGRRVTLASPDEKPLKAGGWFSLKATGFTTEGEARGFGERLKNALQIASIRRVWGVDVGEGRATSAFFKGITDEWAKQGVFARPNIHGLDVYEDKEGTVWTAFSATGTVSTDPEKLFSDVKELVTKVTEDEPPLFDTLRLLNEALISQEAAAQLVLAIAAVEMLAQGEKWSDKQRNAIEELTRIAAGDESLPEDERVELSKAVEAIYRTGVMMGFRRLLHRLGLHSIWKEWRDLYGQRSKILHGLVYASPADRSVIVMPALLLSSRIVLTAMEQHVPGAANDLDEVMPLPKAS
jgi:hypothetical protein